MEKAAPALVAVIGASFAGLFAAAAAAQAGARVVLLERDRLPDQPVIRPGVPQGEQPHVFLHRGLLAAEALLPGLERDLLAAGGEKINTGRMPWLSAYGWFPIATSTYDLVSLSRPLLELLVRRRVLADARIELREGLRVSSLTRSGDRWLVAGADGKDFHADLVVDASGRSSRLPIWLRELGSPTPEPVMVEAKLGYATRRYRGPSPLRERVGIVVAATPATEAGAVVLPVENDEWLLLAAGYGSRRPGRDPDAFDAYLRALPDPAVADLASLLQPVGDVAIYRQTGNRRHAYARTRGWPAGLLVVGDALCAFNPVYGQGITVAATQGERLRSVLSHRLPIDGRPVLSAAATRRLQRQIHRLTEFPWSVATGEDRRFPSCDAERSRVQRLTFRWTERMSRLAAGGDVACREAFSHVYHLMAKPRTLVGPRVVRAVLRSLIRGVPPPVARPAELDGLAKRSVVSPPPGP